MTHLIDSTSGFLLWKHFLCNYACDPRDQYERSRDTHAGSEPRLGYFEHESVPKEVVALFAAVGNFIWIQLLCNDESLDFLIGYTWEM